MWTHTATVICFPIHVRSARSISSPNIAAQRTEQPAWPQTNNIVTIQVLQKLRYTCIYEIKTISLNPMQWFVTITFYQVELFNALITLLCFDHRLFWTPEKSILLGFRIFCLRIWVCGWPISGSQISFFLTIKQEEEEEEAALQWDTDGR